MIRIKKRGNTCRPRISIIIPVFNGEVYLKSCLQSILEGTSQSLELICVNDGSTDTGIDMIREWQKENPCIRLIDLEKNRGLYHARLEGVKAARGDYLGFVDCDDYVSPGYFDRLYQRAVSRKAQVAVGGIVNQNRDGVRYRQTRCAEFPYMQETEREIKPEYEQFWNQAGQCYHWHVIWNKLYKCTVWKRALPILELQKKHLVMMEDFIFSSIVLSYPKKYVTVPEATYYYVENPDAVTQKRSAFQQFDKNIRDMGEAFGFVEQFLKKGRKRRTYLSSFYLWRERYARYWKRNIETSEMSQMEKELSMLLLRTQMKTEVIGEIQRSDEFYYELAELCER